MTYGFQTIGDGMLNCWRTLHEKGHSTKTKVFSDEYLATATNIVTKYVFLSW